MFIFLIPSKPHLSMKELTIYVPQEKLFEVTEILHKHDVMLV